jgi:membrane protease subunit HflC
MKKTKIFIFIIIFIIVIFFITGPFYIISEGEQAVVIRLGKIIQTQVNAGLKIRVPFIDKVIRYSKKILSWDGEAQRIPTYENQFIWVDTTARWKIVDPKKFYESVGTGTQALSRLDDVIDSGVRKIISGNSIREAVRNSNLINDIERRDVYLTSSPDDATDNESVSITSLTKVEYAKIEKGRNQLSTEIQSEAKQITPQYGIELIDIVIRQIKYSDDLTESVYNRMIKERNQIAEAFRSDGEGKKATWIGEMNRELLSIKSGAYKTAEQIKGEADAKAAAIYANAYNRDPEFYAFWKSLESYKEMLSKFNKTLTTEPEYFKYLYNKNGR